MNSKPIPSIGLRVLFSALPLALAFTGLHAADPNGANNPAPPKDPVKISNGNLIKQIKENPAPAQIPQNQVPPPSAAPSKSGGKKGGNDPAAIPTGPLTPDLLKSIGKRIGQPDLPDNLPDLKRNSIVLPDKSDLPLPPLTRRTGKKAGQSVVGKANGSGATKGNQTGTSVGNEAVGKDPRFDRIQGVGELIGDAAELSDAREMAGLAEVLGFGIEGLDPAGLLRPGGNGEFGNLTDLLGGNAKGLDEPVGFNDPLGSNRSNAPAPPSGISFGGIASHEDGDGDDSDVVQKVDFEVGEDGRQTTTVSRGNRTTGVVEQNVIQENSNGTFTVSEGRREGDGSWSVYWSNHDGNGTPLARGYSDSNGNTDLLDRAARREFHRRGGADQFNDNPGEDPTTSEREMNLWVIGRMGWIWTPPSSDPRDKSVKTNPAGGRYEIGVNPPPPLWLYVDPGSFVINPDPNAPSSGPVGLSDRAAAGLREQIRGAGQGVTPGPSGPRSVNTEALQDSGAGAAVEESGGEKSP